MYQQPKLAYASTDSVRRLSSNNPFRQGETQANQPRFSQPRLSLHSGSFYEQPRFATRSSGSLNIHSQLNNNNNFDEWVDKNKQLLDMESDEEVGKESAFVDMSVSVQPPQFPPKPSPSRADSDSSINYGNGRMSNNPFAAAMNEPESYVHHREPPPVPRANNGGSHITPPPRPPKSETAAAPPAYDEITISDKSRREYPREKLLSSESRTRRSGSENRPDRPERPDRPDRLDRPDRPDRPERSDKERAERHRLSKSRREHTSRDPSSRDPSREHRDPSSKEHRHSSGASSKPREHRLKKSPSKKKVEPIKPKNLDTIDKLDVTGFFGGGFHHDGPFDACTPHRNKNVKLAPVMAFPPDGPNNSIKGMGNIAKEKEKQMDLAFGNYNDDQNEIIGRRTSIKRLGGSNDYVEVRSASIGPSSGSNPNGSSTEVYTANPSIINFDARVKAIPVHGSTTAGLGSTTFIDGAPAPKGAEEYLSTSGGGLNRKKSLVQRLRKNSASENSSRRNSNEGGAANNGSNSPIYSPDSSRRGSLNHTETNDNDLAPPPSTGTASSLLRRVKSLKVRR